MGEWHHEAYKARNKSFPAAFTKDFLSKSRRSDNSDEVSKIKFKACSTIQKYKTVSPRYKGEKKKSK